MVLDRFTGIVSRFRITSSEVSMLFLTYEKNIDPKINAVRIPITRKVKRVINNHLKILPITLIQN